MKIEKGIELIIKINKTKTLAIIGNKEYFKVSETLNLKKES